MALLVDVLSALDGCVYKRAVGIDVPLANLSYIIGIGIVRSHVKFVISRLRNKSLQDVVVVNGIVRSKRVVVFQCCLIAVGGTDRMIGIEVIAEFEVGNEGLGAVGEETVLHDLRVVVGHVEDAAEIVVLASVVVHEIGIEVHLQSALPIGHRHACCIAKLMEVSASCHAIETEPVTAAFDGVNANNRAEFGVIVCSRHCYDLHRLDVF